MKKRLLYIPLIILLILPAVGAMHLPFVRSGVLGIALGLFSRSTGIHASAESLDYNLFLLKAELRGGALFSERGTRPFLQFESLALRASPGMIFTGGAYLKEVNLNHPLLTVEIYDDGKNNLPRRERKKTDGGRDGKPLKFRIERLDISGGDVNFVDMRNRIGLNLDTVEINMEHRAELNHYLSMITENPGLLTVRDADYSISSLDVEAVVNPGGIERIQAGFEAGKSRFDVRGNVKHLRSPVFDIRLEAVIDAENLVRPSKTGHEPSGRFDVSAEIPGKRNLLRLHISAESRELKLVGPLHMAADCDMLIEPKRLEIDNIRIETSGGTAEGSARFPFMEDRNNEVVLEWRNIDTETIGRFAGLPLKLSSIMSGELEARWRERDASDISGRADIEMEERSPTVDTDTFPLGGSIKINAAGGEWYATSEGVYFGRLETDVSFELSSRPFGGYVKAETEKLASLIRCGSVIYPDLAGLPPAGGSLSIDARISGNMDSPKAEAELTGSGLYFDRITGVGLDGKVSYEQRVLDFRPLTLDFSPGILTVEGRAGPEILSLSATGTDIPAESIAGVYGVPVSGNVRGDASLDGTPEAPQSAYRVALGEGSAWGADFDSLVAKGTYSDETIYLRSLEMRADDGTLYAGASYGMSSERYTLNADIDNFPLEGFSFPPLQSSLEGVVNANLTGSGSFRRPALEGYIDIDGARYGGCRMGDIRAEVFSDKDMVGINVNLPDHTSSLDARIATSDPRELDLNVKFDGLSSNMIDKNCIAGLPEETVLTLTGELNLSTGFDAPFKDPEGRLSIGEIILEAGGERFTAEGNQEISLKSGILYADDVHIKLGESTIAVDGNIPLRQEKKGAGLTVIAGLDLFLPASFIDNLDGSGWLDIDSRMEGTVTRPSFEGRGSINAGRLHLKDLPALFTELQAELSLRNNILNIDSSRFRWGGGIVEMEGGLPLETLHPAFKSNEPARKAGIIARFDELEPEVIITILDMEADIEGRASGKLNAEFLRPELSSLTAEVRFDELELVLIGVEMTQSEPSLIRLDGERFFVDRLILEDRQNILELSGFIDPVGGRKMDLVLKGEFDLGLIHLFTDTGSFAGRAVADLDLENTYTEPRITGDMKIKEGRIAVSEPGLHFTRLRGTLEFEGDTVKTEGIVARLNGGDFRAEGMMGYSEKTVTADLEIEADDILLHYPQGLRSENSLDLHLSAGEDGYLLEGRAVVEQGVYHERFSLQSEILAYLLEDETIELFRERNPHLEELNYHIVLITGEPLLVDNNVARSEVSADLMLSGDYYDPVITGRAEVKEGGLIFFNRNTYTMERGIVDFSDPSGIDPHLNIRARTRRSGYDVLLVLTGTPDDLTATFTSEPPLAESDIIALLISGRPPGSGSSGTGLNVARNQALGYLSGSLSPKLEKAAGEVLGVDSVMIEPGLAAADESPGGRIVLGQKLTDDLELIYSQGLATADDRSWTLNYNPFRNIHLQGVKRNGDDYSAGLEHEISFTPGEGFKNILSGGFVEKGMKIGNMDFKGKPVISLSKVQDKMKLEEGKRFDFYTFQKDMDRIQKLYRKNDYLTMRMDSRRRTVEGEIDLTINIKAGPKIKLEYRGFSPSSRFEKKVKALWMKGMFEPLNARETEDMIVRRLHRKGFLRASADHILVEDDEDLKHYLFIVKRGMEFDDVDVIFEGNDGIASETLEDFLKRNKLNETILLEPDKTASELRTFYRDRGFLKASVKSPDITFVEEENRAEIVFPIREGPRFSVGEPGWKGGEFFGPEKLGEESGLRPEEDFTPFMLAEAVDRLEDAYALEGYNRAEIDAATEIREDRIDITFNIAENERSIIDEVEFSGNGKTKDKIIRREWTFEEGEPVNYRKINETRRNLYDLGVFSSVDISADPLDDGKTGKNEKAYQIGIKLSELDTYRLRYGVEYDTERLWGGRAELLRRNLFGRAVLAGAGFRANDIEEEARLFINSPYFLGRKLQTDIYAYVADTIEDAYTSEESGVTFQQRINIDPRLLFIYNYTFERSDIRTDYGFDEKLNIGKVNTTLSYDSRDSIMDATRGMFVSGSIEYANGVLASDRHFIKHFGQFYTYRKIGDSLVWASGFRAGLGSGLGEEMIPSERFLAGGGNSIRGFSRNSVGPADAETGVPLGGEALFIMNQELRFPVYEFIGGALFYDMGNVYGDLDDFDPLDSREAAGVGIRVRTPAMIFRLDWGYKLDRREDESPSRFYFSIGQAF